MKNGTTYLFASLWPQYLPMIYFRHVGRNSYATQRNGDVPFLETAKLSPGVVHCISTSNVVDGRRSLRELILSTAYSRARARLLCSGSNRPPTMAKM